MKFGSIPTGYAEGAILAHSLVSGNIRYGKGHVLGADDIRTLLASGVEQVVVARLAPDDIGEDATAEQIATKLLSPHLRLQRTSAGRVNIEAAADGLFDADSRMVDAFNLVDEAIVIGTLSRFAPVRRGDIVATIKVIPYGVARTVVDKARAAATPTMLTLAPFRTLRFNILHTCLDGTSEKIIAKTGQVTARRVAQIGGQIIAERRCRHDVDTVAAALRALPDSDVTLISAASATTDRRDVIPGAIEDAGGRVERLGMPVDPGNLICLGHIGAQTIIGLPGCARSPRRNGIDLVLERLSAGLALDSNIIASMGVGGLLPDTSLRPQPRETSPAHSGPVEAIILAAGKASRMGTNKLVADLGGKPVIAHVVEGVIAAGIDQPIVVVGHEADKVQGALHAYPVRFCEAENFAEGLSQSLGTGIAHVDAQARAAIIFLGDMPFVVPDLVRQFVTDAMQDSIFIPRTSGRRGNPVLWGRDYFARLASLDGDIGGKALLNDFADQIRYFDCDDEGITLDIDTPDQLAHARRRGDQDGTMS